MEFASRCSGMKSVFVDNMKKSPNEKSQILKKRTLISSEIQEKSIRIKETFGRNISWISSIDSIF
jgi:hypothetical protein